MKKMILSITVLSLLFGTTALASSCNIPKFLKKDAKVEMLLMMDEKTLTIVEIDKKSCWVRVKEFGGMWLNLNTIVGINPID